MKKYKVLWLGFAIPDEIAYDLFKIDPSPAIQTHKFGWSCIRALQHNFNEVSLASSCPVQSYPLVPRLIFHGGVFKTKGMTGVLMGFVNLLVLKHITRLFFCITTVAALVRRRHIDLIFIHGLHSPYLLYGLATRLMGQRIVVVLTDPPGLVLMTDSLITRLLKSLDSWLIKKMLNHVDAVLALAPDLVQYLAPGRPALVFPGILESTLDVPNLFSIESAAITSVNKPFTLVYAGGLSKAYGIDRLVDAVRSLSLQESVHLKLYGRGDQEQRIIDISATDARISYGGFVDAEKLLPELCSADLLVNPRPTHELFASLSFPSKLIEYLAMGRPVLTTRIASIPEELRCYYYYIDDESVDGIRLAIRKVMQLPLEMRHKKSQDALIFVRKHFSEVAIGKKIADFIENLNVQN